MRCGVIEDDDVTLSRFRAGLREDFQHELFMREVSTLEHAYQMTQDLKRFQQPQFQEPLIFHRVDSCETSGKVVPKSDRQHSQDTPSRTVHVSERPNPIKGSSAHTPLPPLPHLPGKGKEAFARVIREQ